MEFTPRNDREMAMLIAAIGGATLKDIGAEFGINRERVRQLLKRAGWENRTTRDTLGIKLFGGLHNGGNNAADRERFERAGRKRIRLRQKAARRRQVATLRGLYATLGRTPTLAELAVALGHKPEQYQGSLRYWSGRKYVRWWATATSRLYRIAGVPRPPLGRPPRVALDVPVGRGDIP